MTLHISTSVVTPDLRVWVAAVTGRSSLLPETVQYDRVAETLSFMLLLLRVLA